MLKQNYMLEPTSFPVLHAPGSVQEIGEETQIRLFDKH